MFTWLIPRLALLVALSTTALGQLDIPLSFSRTSWTSEDGLPQNSVSGICQDSDGYLWIATFGGLARFDGKHFEVFDVGNRPDLPSNRFHQVLYGGEDTLWMRVQDVGLMRYRNDQFTRFETERRLLSITLDKGGRVWGIFDGGVGRYSEGGVDSFREGAVSSMLGTSDGAIWISTAEGDLVRLWEGEETVLGPSAGLPGTPFTALFQDATGSLWAGNPAGVWHSTDATNARFERVEELTGGVATIAQDDHGAIWLGSGGSLRRWDPEVGRNMAVAAGRSDCLFVDKRGNLWTGNKGAGLKCIRPGPLHDVTAALGLAPTDTWSITKGRGEFALVVHTRTLVEVLGDQVASKRLSRNTRVALVDRSGDLWVGQFDGLLRIRDGEQTVYGKDAGISGEARALMESCNGTLWIGTGKGLYRRVGERFHEDHPGQFANVRSILEDEGKGVLWVGTQEGLARVEGESVTWLTSKDKLSPGSVRTLHLDHEGILWVGTYGGGLCRIAEGVITRYTRETGLTDNFLACILEDDDGRFWINSNSGPFVVRRADLNRVARGEIDKVACVSFTREEGAREANGGSQPSGWRDPEGRMWFPSIEGVSVADPRELPLDEVPPSVRIESLALGENRALDVRFTGLGFSSPDRLMLQYRLNGHDPEWIDSDGQRKTHYSYVPPGDYVFELRGRNGFGPWSPVVAWSVEIAPRFHETVGFIVLIAVIVGGCALGLAERRIKKARARTAELVLLVEQRERAERSLQRTKAQLRRLSRELLTKQEAERSHISRELHDDVTQRLAALANEAEFAQFRLNSTPDKTYERLCNIAETAQQLAGDVQQLSRRLHPVGLRALGLTEAVRQECDAVKRRDGIDIELAVDVASDEVADDVAVAAFRVFQESMHNIEKHACAQEVQVSLVMESGDLVVSVTDHGAGFELEAGADAGLGLITMRERAASIGGDLSIVSHEGEGTTVRLRAPGRRN